MLTKDHWLEREERSMCEWRRGRQEAIQLQLAILISQRMKEKLLLNE